MNRRLIVSLVGILVLQRLFLLHAAPREVDVLVYGATPGGFCAAIAAAREGATVALVEPTGHVGGMNTGGLSWSDSNQTVRDTVRGLFEEWHLRISADYERRGVGLPYNVRVKDATPWTYEPHVAMRVTRELLAEARVEIRTHAVLERVALRQGHIQSLHTRDGNDHVARVFVDATYEGDLLAASGVSWTVGREGRDAFGESLAGRQYPKKRMEISGLDEAGQPLSLITDVGLGEDSEGDASVMVYSFRLSLTRDPANRVPFPLPDHYDPKRFEVIRSYFGWEQRPVLLWDLYPVPGNKLDGNNGIGKQFSLGLVGACNGWSEASLEERQRIQEEHRQYTLELYHFLTTDPSVPEKLRRDLAQIGLCRDEFADNGHWPPQLYVREGRRMQGQYILSQKDILESPAKEDPIIVSSFPIDSHDCRRIALPGGGVINEGTIFPVRMPGRRNGYPYHVPYRSILPKAGECSNLLVPVALSCTHVALSSIRVEPTWMILGQSAGIAAALVARDGGTVQSLPYDRLRPRLLAQGQVLDLPDPDSLKPLQAGTVSVDPGSIPGTVLDDADAQLSGNWATSTNFKPHIGRGYLHDESTGDGKSRAVWTFQVKTQGTYQMSMAYSAHPTRATRVPMTIRHGEKEVQWAIDQTVPLPSGQLFRKVGQVELPANAEIQITITNEGTDGFVILDAIHLVRLLGTLPGPVDPGIRLYQN